MIRFMVGAHLLCYQKLFPGIMIPTGPPDSLVTCLPTVISCASLNVITDPSLLQPLQAWEVLQ